MDPATAFGVAASALTFLEFGTKLVSKGKELYQSADGVLVEHAEQAAVTERLRSLTDGLDGSLRSLYSAQLRLSPAEQALHGVLEDCKASADSFILALDELKVTGRHRKFKSFRQAFKAVWSKDALKDRIAKMDSLRQDVQVHLLVVVHQSQNSSTKQLSGDVQNLRNAVLDGISQSKVEIRQDIRQLNIDLSEAQKDNKNHGEAIKRMQSVIHTWQSNNRDSLDRIAESIRLVTEGSKQRAYQKAILDSLYFDRIDDRHSKVDEKADTTLNWIFTSDASHSWSDVPAWLREANGLYWVAGKAGSGKSTLMKWLLQDSRTRSNFAQWSPTEDLLIAEHFFWSSGTELQNSLAGFLRALLYNLLGQKPECIMSLSPVRWRSFDLELQRFPSWGDAELLSATRQFFSKIAGQARVALFVDGLDECTDESSQQQKLISLLQELSRLEHVKICVSSRPLQLFQGRFSQVASLRLEKLTETDIREYIRSTLLADDRFKAMMCEQPKVCSDLLAQVIDKADGVWLWVRIVVASLLNGLEHNDTIADLQERVSQAPSEMDLYFRKMLSAIEKVYRLNAIKFLRMALNWSGGLPLVAYSYLDDLPTMSAVKMPLEPLSEDILKKKLDNTRIRVNSRCLGLLEVRKRPEEDWDEISFIHRTAKDFLHENPDLLLLPGDMGPFDEDQYLLNACLAGFKAYPVEMKLSETLLSLMLEAACRLEKRNPYASLDALRSLDTTISTRQQAILHLTGPRDGYFCEPRWVFTKEEPHPFLSLAIIKGLNTWANETIKAKPRLLLGKRGTSLLHCAVVRLWTEAPDVSLVGLILSLDSSPNEMIAESTVWRAFVRCIDRWPRLGYLHGASERDAWIAVTELMLRYGAPRLLERRTVIPAQRPGTTRVRFAYVDTLAVTSFQVGFGDAEAQRLDDMAKWLEVSGQQLWVNSTRHARSFFR